MSAPAFLSAFLACASGCAVLLAICQREDARVAVRPARALASATLSTLAAVALCGAAVYVACL